MIDIGVNITSSKFKNKHSVINNAKDAGITGIILTGTSYENSKESLLLAEKYPGYLKTTIGVHPHNADSFTVDTMKEMERLLKNPLTVAVGECGLDFDRNYSSKEGQLYAFEEQLKIADKVNKPLFLHERSAHEDFVTVLKQYPTLAEHSVVHCFTGTKEQLKTYLELGCYIGVTGWVCDKKRGIELRDALKYMPLERLMIETDAPYLIPKDLIEMPKNRINEPKYLGHIGQSIAGILNVSDDVFFETVTKTTKQFFNLK